MRNRRSRRLISGVLLACIALALFSCAPAVTRPQPKPVRIALVLGAGASRGFAHIGVLKVLEANRIPVHMIVGTSAGSFVGSLYAYGFNAFQVQKMALTIQKSDIFDLAVPDNGFIKGERLGEYINAMVMGTPLEKMKIPFYAVATAIPEGREVVFATGNTGTAVRASCSIPGIFRPVRINDALYVDGGVVSPVAVAAARRQGADIIIAVDISADTDKKQPEGTIETILQTVTIMHSRLAKLQTAEADILIRPNVGHIGTADFDRRHEAILEGEKAALDAMPAIQAIVESLRQAGRLG